MHLEKQRWSKGHMGAQASLSNAWTGLWHELFTGYSVDIRQKSALAKKYDILTAASALLLLPPQRQRLAPHIGWARHSEIRGYKGIDYEPRTLIDAGIACSSLACSRTGWEDSFTSMSVVVARVKRAPVSEISSTTCTGASSQLVHRVNFVGCANPEAHFWLLLTAPLARRVPSRPTVLEHLQIYGPSWHSTWHLVF
jgi:hypothetical protein